MSAPVTDRKPRSRAAPKKRPTPRGLTKEARIEGASEPSAPVTTALAMPVETAQIKYLISERPELIESDLSVYVDEEGQLRGVDFQTEVGEIDLLARSPSGDWVVIMVASDEMSGDVITGVLQRLGWVRKHLCGVDQNVRGIWASESMSARP